MSDRKRPMTQPALVSGSRLPAWVGLFVHLRLHYQLLFLSPLFAWGFMLAHGAPSFRALVAFIAFHVFLYGGVTAYNSFYDRDEGPVGGLRSPPKVTPGLLGFSLVVQVIGLVLALWVGLHFTALYVVTMLLSVAYSHPRPRWKARPILSLLVVAFGQGSMAFASGWLVSSASPPPLFASREGVLGIGVATLMTVGFYPLTQLYQIDEDRARGDRTFAVAFGANASFDFSLACLALGGLGLVLLALHVFGGRDALIAGSAFGVFLGVILRWRSRFRNRVQENFWVLHRLQLGLSMATLGYVSLKLFID